MSEPKKRTISQEQLNKMAEGRKKAMAERRKLREQESKEKPKKKRDEQKQKELDLELQALAQQKDAVEAKKKTIEHRKQFRDKIKKDEVEIQIADLEGEIITDYKEEQAYSKAITMDELEEALEEAEEEELERGARQEEDAEDAMIAKAFKAQCKSLAEHAKPEVKKEFLRLTDNYDNSANITDNLNRMATELKKMIKANAKQAKKVDKVIKEEVKSLPVKPVEEKTVEEVKDECRYQSQLSSLMRLR